MPPKKVKQQQESDDFDFLGSQDSNSGDTLPPALQEAIVKQYIANKEKKKQEKERRFLEQASTMLKKDLSKASQELQTATEAMEMEYTKFVNEYAATEDRIYHLWSEILKEHLALASLIQKKYDAGITTMKGVEKQHVSGLAKLRSSCQDFESIISKMATNLEGGEDDRDVLIAVMGVTGSGKTTFINLATQSPNKLQVGHSIQSCTNAVERADPFDLDGRRISLFNTPGFDDSNMSETEILGTIAAALENQYRKGQTLHGIIYVHRISDLRVGGLARTNFGIFRKLYGNPSLQNITIMTSMWSCLSSELEGRRRVEELASVGDFFKPAIVRGAVMMNEIQDTVDSAHAVIRQILKNHPIALDIQKEIVDEHKSIN